MRSPMLMSQKKIDVFVQNHAEWIQKNLKKAKDRAAAHPPLDDNEIKRLKALAKEILPQRIKYYSELMGLYPTKVTITSAKTRFGSCSGKNSISFSCRLMQYPIDAVDYVVVHELAHIKHHNHSKDFYALIEKHLPDYKNRQKLLKG